MANLIKSIWLKLGLPVYVVQTQNKYIGPEVTRLSQYKQNNGDIFDPTFINSHFVFLTKNGAINEGLPLYKIFSWKDEIQDAKFLSLADKMVKEGKIGSYRDYKHVATTGEMPDEIIDVSSVNSNIFS